MDTTAKEIQFTATGCNFCDAVTAAFANKPSVERRKQLLEQAVDEIKTAGKGKPYDCIVGVSGGVDSTYVAYLTKAHGLRPLAVHFDNGWNSELAVSNIERALTTLGIQLNTFVMDWPEFRRLQLSFLRASVPDAEIPTDHGIHATIFKAARKFGIKHLISGANAATEAILPRSWTYGVTDWKYIKDVFSRFGEGELRRFPHVSFLQWQWFTKVLGLKHVFILDLIEYNKSEAIQTLQNKLGWKYYGGKHYESVYTRFFQAYILPSKFGIDKRKAHLSTLIATGQISRSDAMTELQNPICPPEMVREDRAFVLKKLGLSEEQFQTIMETPPRTYEQFQNSENFLKLLTRLRFWR